MESPEKEVTNFAIDRLPLLETPRHLLAGIDTEVTNLAIVPLKIGDPANIVIHDTE